MQRIYCSGAWASKLGNLELQQSSEVFNVT